MWNLLGSSIPVRGWIRYVPPPAPGTRGSLRVAPIPGSKAEPVLWELSVFFGTGRTLDNLSVSSLGLNSLRGKKKFKPKQTKKGKHLDNP